MKNGLHTQPTLTALALLLFFLSAMPALYAAPTTKFKNNVEVTGNLTVDGASTVTGAQVFSGNVAITGNNAVTGNETVGGTEGITGNTTVGGTLGVTGDATLSGALNVTGAVALTAPLTAANIQTGSAKRELGFALTSPAGGAVTVNGTVYFGNIYFGRAGVVKKITYGTHVDPVSGTNTIKVLKNGASGNTMLSAASVSLNGATADVGQVGALTATSGDLALAATDSVYCEYSAGTQGSVAKDVKVTVEFEPTDF